MRQRLYRILIAPRSTDADDRRREFVLNSLLAGLATLGLIASIISCVNYALGIIIHVNAVVSVLIFETIVAGLLLMSRRASPKLAAIVFQVFLLASAVLFVMSWSYRLPEAQLVFALMVVIAGVLFNARLGLAAGLTAVLCLLVVAGFQIAGLQHPYTGWQSAPLSYTDLFGCSVVFIGMGLVSWLSNRETSKSLQRARASERELAQERDNLELTVAARTRELEDLQVARVLEIQPFAEFGRIGASLVHEIANPLTAATLQLEEVSRQQQSELVHQAQRSLQQLEKYLLAARKQIKRESDLRQFAVGREISQIVRLLQHRARRANVRLVVNRVTGVRLYGDVVKFDQLVANVIANAIDASEASGSTQPVVVAAQAADKGVVITITDNGSGISEAQMSKIFEPLYTTKDSQRSGMGLGLALVKQYVEQDFRGKVTVTSNPKDGTCFSLLLRGRAKS